MPLEPAPDFKDFKRPKIFALLMGNGHLVSENFPLGKFILQLSLHNNTSNYAMQNCD